MNIVLVHKGTGIWKGLPKDFQVPIFGDTIKIDKILYVVNNNHFDFNTGIHYVFLKTYEEFRNED